MHQNLNSISDTNPLIKLLAQLGKRSPPIDFKRRNKE